MQASKLSSAGRFGDMLVSQLNFDTNPTGYAEIDITIVEPRQPRNLEKPEYRGLPQTDMALAIAPSGNGFCPAKQCEFIGRVEFELRRW